jgi:hypothetical protein
MALALRALALSPLLASALDGMYQLQPTNDDDATPPVARSGVHMRHCTSEVFVTEYATEGPKDDFKWKFEDALNGNF